MVRARTEEHRRIRRPGGIAAGILLAIAASCLIWLWTRTSTSELLGDAYRQHRTLALRISGAPYGDLRSQGNGPLSPAQRPLALLEAEARISRGLAQRPDDPELLAERGQANLLEGTYEAAIADLQRVVELRPHDATALNELASAYFARGRSEHRFADYSDAFELQSRALQVQPENPVALFNRAITAERLFLFKQCFDDWERYLQLDHSGKWAMEARGRLADAQAMVSRHDGQALSGLLTAAGFAGSVDAKRPETWSVAEPRIEQYLSQAVTIWLPLALKQKGLRDSADAHHALQGLATILQVVHGDTWLADVLSARPSGALSEAAESLAEAVVADSISEDYVKGRSAAVRAEKLFAQAGDSAGEMRAAFEEIYALRFSDASAECLKHIHSLSGTVEKSSYKWLQIQLQLEHYNCSSESGDLDRAGLLTSARDAAQASHYPALALRAIGFLAFDQISKGNLNAGWSLCEEGLRRYWSGSVSPMLAYNLYDSANSASQASQLWHLDRAITAEGLGLVAWQQNPLMRAIGYTNLAHAAIMAKETPSAAASLKEAEHLMAGGANSEVTGNYRMTVDTYSALVAGLSGDPGAGLAQLEGVRPTLGRVANTHVLAEFYRTAGALENQAGHSSEAEKDFTIAVALGEQQRRSLSSEADRADWTREWTATYLDLIDTYLRQGRSTDALDLWELYREHRPFAAETSPPSSTTPTVTDTNAEVASLHRSLADESQLIRNASPSIKTGTVVAVILLPHGIAAWSYDDRGVSAQWLEQDPTYIRMEARRFAELCSSPASSLEAIHASARQLYDALVKPVAARLRAGEPVMVEADETLRNIPFQALISADEKYLSDEHPVVYLPAVSYLNTASAAGGVNRDSKVLAVAGGAGESAAGLRPLSDAAAEAKMVLHNFDQGNLLVDRQASLPAVESGLRQAEIFHFAGHALAQGNRAGLLLAGGHGRGDAIFDAAALRTTRLSDLRLVVLSACSTENGTENTSVDSSSLARGFLARGVPHVLATRWDIDSGSAESLMEKFYGQLLSGKTVSASLAESQRELRQTAPHPYYWAAFDAFGEN